MDAFHIRQTTSGQPKLLRQRLIRQGSRVLKAPGNVHFHAGGHFTGGVLESGHCLIDATDRFNQLPGVRRTAEVVQDRPRHPAFDDLAVKIQ